MSSTLVTNRSYAIEGKAPTIKSGFDYPSQTNDKKISSRPWDIFGKSQKAFRNIKSDYTLVSLFSGCGGLDLGFHFAGFKTLWANDLNPEACETFSSNIGPIITGDIRKVGLPHLKGKVDVLAAGFPCQPFSNAGSRKGLDDGRGKLYQEALKAINALKPKVVIFENVRGILSFKNGHKPLVEDICEELQTLNFKCTFKLVDSSDHGVGQRRIRLFIVGVSKKEQGKFSFPNKRSKAGLNIGTIIQGLDNKSPNQTELLPLNPQAITLGALVPEGGSWKNIPYKMLPERLKRIADNIERYRWPNFYRRFHRNEIAGTITAAFKPENAGVWHPTLKRVFSVREIARIQSFPDWYRFKGKTIKSKYEQIGNAIPPRLAYEIALEIRKVLKGNVLEGDPKISNEAFLKLERPLRPSDSAIEF